MIRTTSLRIAAVSVALLAAGCAAAADETNAGDDSDTSESALMCGNDLRVPDCNATSCSYSPSMYIQGAWLLGEGFTSTVMGFQPRFQVCLERSSWSGFRTYACSDQVVPTLGREVHIAVSGCLSGDYDWHTHAVYTYCGAQNVDESPLGCDHEVVVVEDSVSVPEHCNATQEPSFYYWSVGPEDCKPGPYYYE